MIHTAVSRSSLDTLRTKVGEVSARFSTSDGLSGLAGDLYGVAGILVAQSRLRRSVSDAATDPDNRAQLMRTLFEGKISVSALSVVADAVRLRWSSAWDLGDALEQVGDETLLAAADSAGELGEVEDELFRFGRTLNGEDRLVTLLDQAGASTARKTQLLETLIAGKVRPATLALLTHAIVSTRRRSIELSIDDLLEAVSARQLRSMARVVSAVPLSAEQEARLAQVLTGIYGRTIGIRSSVEPHVRGGLLIHIGDEVIDGTLEARFAAARAALAT